MDRKIVFDGVRQQPFGGLLTQPAVDGINVILDAWDRRGLSDIRWLAYMLATTFHETARTMQPIREFGGARARYAPYYGRGFVQLTWEANYRKASEIIGADLVGDPDKALDPAIAVVILFDGMIKGWFTGHRLSDYINGATCDYVEARRIINGTDRAVTIAAYAASFERALKAATANQMADGLPAPVVPVTPAQKPNDPPSPPASAPPSPPDDPAVPEPTGFWGVIAKFLVAFIETIFPRQ